MEIIYLEQSEVGLPLVADDLATRETTDGDDHLYQEDLSDETSGRNYVVRVYRGYIVCLSNMWTIKTIS